MKRSSRIALVIPARDEEKFLPRVLAGVPEWIWRVILIDDGSRDGTWAVMTSWHDERAERIRLRPGRGVGGAILAGYRRVLQIRAASAVVVAGDGQMDPDQIAGVVAPIEEGWADYVQGNRFLRGRPRGHMPLLRRWGNRWLSAASSWASRTPIGDSQCGFTAASLSFLEQLSFSRIPPGYGFPAFVRLEAHRMRAHVAEVPVNALYGDEVSGIHPLRDPLWICLRILSRRMEHNAPQPVPGRSTGTASLPHSRVGEMG